MFNLSFDSASASIHSVLQTAKKASDIFSDLPDLEELSYLLIEEKDAMDVTI